ncbi:FecR family protein [Novosphingobium album (ex Liu et al. 2023)]|uniref:FecR domain-containing protein n=1 Tax=Novosphingobium album (ex Liu et al. 2023) TaxID=3031130 RepID=A0ABT5WME2_9SPHN|nr:FecR domain-containing protein [Novosphingobium album (ex Liu et al. 2023)]MDE8651219.1 FecR domain-containing protein [Novosphingobium album (ex Liu et al. 2023)]
MARTGPANSINDQAARWAVEAAHGEMTPANRAELEAWLAADRRHRGAFARARAWLRATEEAVIEAHSPPASPRPASPAPASDNDNGHGQEAVEPAPLRGGLFRWSARAVATGAALTVSVAALVAMGVPVLAPFRQSELAAAEQVVQLKDGSVATLREDAQIQVVLSDNIRRIKLLRGEATFKVAKDKARPFVVQSGDVYAQATGTVYSVRRVGLTGGMVKVREGSVLVWPHDERDQAVLLHAGGTVTLDPGPNRGGPEPTASTAPRLPPPELAQISLDNVPIRSAVVRFNRVNSTKIIIADPEIGNIRIIGLYRANNPEQFAQAAAAISGGHISRENGTIVIKMK